MKNVSSMRLILLVHLFSYGVQAHYTTVKATITTIRPTYPSLSLSNNGNFSDDSVRSRTSEYHENDSSRTTPTSATISPISKKRHIVDYESVSLALRLTCEVNRRLYLGIRSSDSVRNNDQASIFYTPPSKRTNLTSFVENIHKVFRFEHDPIVAAIIMIYLDRACSAETYRLDDRSIACPYITKTNVHKLYLAASVLAVRAVRNELPPILSPGAFHDDITDLYLKKLKEAGSDDTLGIVTTYELGTLIEWMFASLGADGTIVNIEQVRSFIDKWKSLFEWECKL